MITDNSAPLKSYIASYTTSEQISPEDWKVFNPSLKIDENTTVGEINNWFSRRNGAGIMQVSIIQLENIQS